MTRTGEFRAAEVVRNIGTRGIVASLLVRKNTVVLAGHARPRSIAPSK